MSTGSARLGAVTFLATAGAVVGALLVHSAAAEPQRVSARPSLAGSSKASELSMNVPRVGNGTTDSRSPGTRSGPQGAEAVLFWAGFPGGRSPHACESLTDERINSSVSELAAAVARAPGTKLVKGPANTTVGGYPSKRVVLNVREDVGCDPGFFYRWHATMGGAFWLTTGVGATIEVWIVKVDGRLLFIEAATTKDGRYVRDEIRRMVGSIRFG